MLTQIPHRLRAAKLFDVDDLQYFLHSVIDAMPPSDDHLVSIENIATTVGKVLEAMLVLSAQLVTYTEPNLSNTAG